MAFIDRIDPEIVGALDAHQAERYRKPSATIHPKDAR